MPDLPCFQFSRESPWTTTDTLAMLLHADRSLLHRVLSSEPRKHVHSQWLDCHA